MARLDEIFRITYGSQLDLNKCEICGKGEGYNFVNRSSVNCGVSARILKKSKKEPFKAGCITTAMGGSILASFVQQEDFYTGQNVKVLVPPEDMTLAEKLYYCQCIEANRFRFSTFGREANYSFNSMLVPSREEVSNDIKQQTIGVDFISNPILSNKLELNINEWKWFKLGDLFPKIYKAKAHVKQEVNITNDTANGLIFVSRTETNNGCDVFVERDDSMEVEAGKAIIIGDTTATCFYQEKEFTTGDHIIVCRSSWLNKYTALFFKTIMDNEKYRFNYGRAFKMELVKEHKIKLPATTNEQGKTIPDWQWMEDYIKGLPYSGCL